MPWNKQLLRETKYLPYGICIQYLIWEVWDTKALTCPERFTFSLSAPSLTDGDRISERIALQCLCRAHLHMQCATLALLHGPSRLATSPNANDLLHAGLHICHAKRRADIAWPHGRGLAA
jgi:hypothetical protein